MPPAVTELEWQRLGHVLVKLGLEPGTSPEDISSRRLTAEPEHCKELQNEQSHTPMNGADRDLTRRRPWL